MMTHEITSSNLRSKIQDPYLRSVILKVFADHGVYAADLLGTPLDKVQETFSAANPNIQEKLERKRLRVEVFGTTKALQDWMSPAIYGDEREAEDTFIYDTLIQVDLPVFCVTGSP